MVKKIVFVFLVGVLGISLIGIGYFIGYLHRATIRSEIEGYPLLEEAHSLVLENYFGDIPDLLILQRGMIHGMVGKFGDRFTTYVEPVANELQGDDLKGRFGGIGAHLTRDDNGFIHVVPYPESPAAEAGILEEYLLIAIDDMSITTETGIDEIVTMIRGDIGTSITLTFRKDGLADQHDYVLIRDEFEIPSVTSYLLPSNQEIGVIIIHRFSDRTVDEIESSYDELVESGIHGLLLDLRGNTGGILNAAIDVARFFLDNGLILIQTERDGEVEEYEVNRSGKGSEIPMVALIDAGTASASEVLAAALNENERAPLIGERSFGKGSIQSILSLSDGSSLHVTTARWMTPSEISIDGVGVKPDVIVGSGDTGRDEIFDAGIVVLLDLIEDQG